MKVVYFGQCRGLWYDDLGLGRCRGSRASGTSRIARSGRGGRLRFVLMPYIARAAALFRNQCMTYH